MKNFFIYLSNRHEVILKGFIILITVTAIATLLPHKVRYRFEFQKGKAWSGDDLVASFDFAVLKNPDSLRHEIIHAVQAVPPHFQFDTLVYLQARASMDQKYATLPESQRSILLGVGGKVLRELFTSGITRTSDLQEAGQVNRVVIIKGKMTTYADPATLTTIFSAPSRITEKLIALNIDSAESVASKIAEFVTANVYYDRELTQSLRAQAAASISEARGMVRKGDLIISRGEQVTAERMLVLESLKKAAENVETDNKTIREIFAGQMILVSIGITMLLIFLAALRKDIFADNRKVTLIFTLMILVTAAYTGAMKFPLLNVYVVPVCILPIVIRVFFDTRLALFTHVVTVLILGSVAPNGFEFVFMQVIAGMVTIFAVTNLRKRAQFFTSAGMIFISYVVCYFSISVIHEGSIRSVEVQNLLWLIGNVLLTLFSYPLIYIFEKLFGLTSDVSLMELGDTNTPLLRELSIRAPGTFQHSLQVANLAEAAIYKIGGNSLLIRVGALYHDIGKMDMSLYFIENQSTGVNPHDELSFAESASIIISHVLKGIEKARKNKLPDLVIDFIRTHHGTSVVQYFYQSFLKNYPEEIVDEEDFRYPGPLPFSKETAVLMMADSVEASSRSLKQPTQEIINKHVDQIIDGLISQQQFVNCDITFRDISSIKKIFKKMLLSIYHIRIEYPRG